MRAPRQPRKPRSITPADNAQIKPEKFSNRELEDSQGKPTTADFVETAAYAHSAPAAETAPIAAYEHQDFIDDDQWTSGDDSSPSSNAGSRQGGLAAKLSRVKGRFANRSNGDDREAELEQHSEYQEWRRKLAAAMPTKPVAEKAGNSEGTKTKKKNASVLSLTDRLTEQRHEVRKARIKRLAGVLALAGVFAFMTWLLLFSPLLRISESNTTVSYDGPSNATSEAQVNAVLKQYEGDQLLRIDRSALESDLEAIPEVASATVSASPFSGLSVEIKPQYPVVCIYKNNVCAPFSAKGDELKLPAEMTQHLPVLETIPDGIDAKRALKDINQLFGYLNTDLTAQVAKLKVSSGYQLAFTFKDGREVFWGISKDGDAKARVLRSILAEPKSKIDVSVPSAAVAK
ncbi:cell division protein FtsQ/DivIB [Arcanobacterium bovis]|uniref:FtsQ-type POTRA domain-containing protein n=1 Tax=Arcanobacterium bovis TaxID=2529275 RepID=A0A4Q9V100_9ACTO|nr:FtsQ-type POTRA domain-containing protein [Arcanobacterium bovis]TBW22764.1 FtsQ-type POTRA domain-containing protein [Arcanobacterium bovis]